jgi:hypothetical protein
MISLSTYERLGTHRGGQMKRRNWTVAAALASVAALIAVPSALAAYTTPKLEVRQAGATTTFRLTQSSSEDPTAVISIFVPTGTTLTTSQAPGTTLGKASALLKLHALAGAEVPVDGNVVVASIGPGPGQVSPATQQRCTQGVTPLATWVLSVSIAGNAVAVPVFLVPTSGALMALGPAYVRACFTSPYLTVDQGGLAGAPQVVNAEFAVQGVFSPVGVGAFVAVLVPWTTGTGTPNLAGTVATPAAIAPGAVTAAARTRGAGATVTGRVTQAGQPRGGATVTIFGGARRTGLKSLGRARVSANGAFTFRARAGTFFRARAVAAGGAALPLCTQLGPALAPVPCVNPTVSGFTAQSRVVRKR